MINNGGTGNRNKTPEESNISLEVFASGEKFSIFFPQIEGNSVRIKKILGDLQKKYRKEFTKKLIPRVNRLCKHGVVRNPEIFKKLENTDPALFEIKSHQLRLALLQREGNYVLVHALIKKSDKWPDSDIKCAMQTAKDEILN